MEGRPADAASDERFTTSTRRRLLGTVVYAGIDPDTRKQRYRTATVTGNRADAERGLARLVSEVQSEKTIGSTSTGLGPARGMVRDRLDVMGSDHDPRDPLNPRPLSSSTPGQLPRRRRDPECRRRNLREASNEWQCPWRPTQAGDPESDKRGAEVGLLAGTALGMGMGKPCRTSSPDRGATSGAPASDAGRVAASSRLHPAL